MAARDISGVVAASGRREEVQAGYWAAVGYTPPGGPAALAEDGSDEHEMDSESHTVVDRGQSLRIDGQ
jgi:hypothetical protein